jgi:hypothetical protein
MTRRGHGGDPGADHRAHRRVVLHVGLPKTGTTYLQALLAGHRDALRDAGVLYPFVRPGAMFLGAVEVRGSHDKFGLTAQDVAGTWAALCERVRAHDGTSIISHEILGGAEPDEIAGALEPLDGLDLDIVITARDLGRQATADWQEEVKLGDTRSFADFEREELRTDVPGGTGAVRPHFWHAQDYAAALRRWSVGVPEERVHLVVCPPPGAPSELLWRRFADACGIAGSVDGLVDAGAVPAANPSLGAAQIALLRRLNAELDGRLDPRAHARLVKRGLAEGLLTESVAGVPVTAARVPASLGEVLVPAAQAWGREIAAGGHPVHGDLTDLTPVLAVADDPHPDDVPDAVVATLAIDVLAASLLSRGEIERVDSVHEGTGNAGGASVPARAAERLRRRLRVVHRD